ncbi:TniQ family protein [Paracoccus sp. J55]|uniref:TniQ family protein n=1 Tax=Paracoccus sp. J55 TaxID=935849 RepID=UPI000A038308|nr:TniQ family protein [Paracoccus sp. J55]
MRLGLSLPILPQETLPSFVSHVARKKGSRHVQDFVQDMDLSWRRILQLDPDTVQQLADLTGTDTERLAKNSFAPIGDSSFRLQGSNLPRSFLDRSALKFCPICIKADQDNHGRTRGRALWQIDSLHVCPDHDVLLGRLDPPDYPRCPHDFAGRLADNRVLVGEAAVEAGDEAVRYARMLSDRLHAPRQSARHSWLDALPIEVVARLCENIGTLINVGPEARPGSLNRKDLVAVGASGFAACVQGPDALREAYDGIRRSSRSTKGGFYADFGFYTRWLQRLTQPDRYRPILDHFRDLILESYPLAPGQKVLGRVCSQRRWFSWAEIGRRYGLTAGRIAGFQRAVGLAGDDLRRVAPGRHDVELTILSTGLDRKQASRHLNVHPATIDKLVEFRLIKHALALPHMDKLFLHEDLDSFLVSVFANAGLAGEVPTGAFPLRTIAQKATLPYNDLLRAVIDGRLAKVWRLRGIRGLAALHLDLAEVLDRFEAAPLMGLSRDDLRKRLHINCSTVALFMGKGVIASTEARHPRTRQPMSLVAPEEVERFLDRYLPLGLMAYELGTQAKHVAVRLDDAEVWPIPLPERCSKIYLRREAAPIISI